MVQKHQKISVGGFLVRNNKVLVIKRSKKESYLSGFYELPGGKIDFGEHPEKSLEREFLEEVNLKIKVLIPYRIFDYISHNGNRHSVEIVYLVELKDKKSKINNLKLSEEHENYKWIGLDEIDSIKLSNEIKKNIIEGFKLLRR